VEYEQSDSTSIIVNKALFYGIESILKVLTSNEDIYISTKNKLKNFNELINIIKDILQSAFKLEANLILSTNEAFSLKEIIEIIEALNKNNINIDENIKEIIEYFSEQTLNIYKPDNDDDIFEKRETLIKNFENFYNYLKSLLGNSDSFNILMPSIIRDEYSKVQDDKFRYKLLEIITSKNEFIYNCYPLLKQILKGIKISINPKDIDNNLKTIADSNDSLINNLKDKKSEFLDHVILQIFERLFKLFFYNISKK
jgi:hypothetical protein